MPGQLTALQEAILEIEKLGLPLRDAMLLATRRVGFFVGQQRYTEELSKAHAILAAEGSDVAHEVEA